MKVFGNLEATDVLGKDDGIFAHTVRELLPHLPLIDETHLNNRESRWEFLVRVQLHFFFRKSSKDINSLLDFHSRAKYLFMSISQKDLSILDQILARHQKDDFHKTLTYYRRSFHRILTKPIRKSNLINIITHMFGYVSQKLNPSERNHFIRLLDNYHQGKTDFVTLIEVLRSYGYLFNLRCLLNQYLLTLE